MKIFTSFIFFVLIQNLYSQTSIEDIYSVANKLYENGNYFSAITEFKRVLFFDDDKKYSFDANYKIGLSYKKGGFFENAIYYLTIAQKFATNEEDLFDIKINIIRCNILRKTTEKALQLCNELESQFQNKKDEILYWKGWCYIFANDWENAEKNFAKSSLGNELYLISRKVNKEKLSVTFAKVISYILPGSGQVYAGYYLNGIISLIWNLTAGYFTVNSFVTNRAFDGIVIGELVWLRFYKGNIENAVKYTEEKNLNIINNALNYLQKEYKGLKP